jgi:hypothetical protein
MSPPLRAFDNESIGVAQYPVDNLDRGGIVCSVDVESGEVGRGDSFHPSFGLICHERHPDTDVPITGTVIPNWKDVKSKILEIADCLAVVPYMG